MDIWITASECIGLPGLPGSLMGVHKRSNVKGGFQDKEKELKVKQLSLIFLLFHPKRELHFSRKTIK